MKKNQRILIIILALLGVSGLQADDGVEIIPFKNSGNPGGTVTWLPRDHFLVIRSGNSVDTLVLGFDGEIERFQDDLGRTVVIDSAGNEDVTLHGIYGGTSVHWHLLVAINPRTVQMVVLTLEENYDPRYPATDTTWEIVNPTPYPLKEVKLLEDLKYQFGFRLKPNLSTFEPAKGEYLWLQQNDSTVSGQLHTRRYKGRFWSDHRSSADTSFTIDSITYYYYFKCPIVAYDHRTDEEYVLFMPHDYYHFPDVFAYSKPNLVIGTRGEGIAIIDLERMYLRRIMVGQEGIVGSIQILGTKLVINGSDTVDIPKGAP